MAPGKISSDSPNGSRPPGNENDDRPWWHDRRRPELPYLNGETLSIKRHKPPQPFGPGYIKGSSGRPRIGNRVDRELTDLEWCLGHPLMETPPHHDRAAHQLHILDAIVRKDEQGAQILRCTLDGKGPTLVAKIYDPLYYPFYKGDVTWLADQDYSRETAAYEDLQERGVDGVLVPKYYGSWTFTMPILGEPAGLLRPVRMILLEWIDAVSMWSLIQSGEAYKIAPEKRLDLLAKAMEVECRTSFHGVKTLDFAPRNVLISGCLDTPDPSIRLIDFNHAIARRRPHVSRPELKEERPVSPLYVFWRGTDTEFYCWLPRPHRRNIKVFRGWLISVWGNSKSEEFGHWPEDSEEEDEDMSEGTYEYAEPLPDDEEHDPRTEDG